jgi:cold shock CspA family protein
MKARMLGTCVSYNGSYAWLRPAEGKDVFVHESEWPDGTIQVGDKCTFDVAPDHYKPGRFRAMNVRLVDGDDKKPSDDVGPGMYAEPDAESALAEGLRKLLRKENAPER